jgi:hypothetical protein
LHITKGGAYFMNSVYEEVARLVNTEMGGKIVIILLFAYLTSLILLYIYARSYDSDLFTTLPVLSMLALFICGIVYITVFKRLNPLDMLICFFVSALAWIPVLSSSFRRRIVRGLHYVLYSPIISQVRAVKWVNALGVSVVSAFFLLFIFNSPINASNLQEDPGSQAVTAMAESPAAAVDVPPVATPEPTPVATPEPTPVATPEPTPIATPEPTPVATTEPTPVATPEPTPIATPEPTPVATPEPTPIATPEPTPVATPEPPPVATPVATPEPTPVATPEPTPVATPEPTLSPSEAPQSINALSQVPEQIYVEKGKSIPLINIEADNVTWSSADNNIATVDAKGTVTAVSLGTVVITGASPNSSAGCTVTVREWVAGRNEPLWVEEYYEDVWVDEQTVERTIPGYYESYTVPGYYEDVVISEGHYQDVWVEGHNENETIVPGYYESVWVEGHYTVDENGMPVWVDGLYEERWVDEVVVGDWYEGHMETQWVPEKTERVWTPEETRQRWIEEKTETQVIEGHFEQRLVEGHYEDKWVDGHWIYE